MHNFCWGEGTGEFLASDWNWACTTVGKTTGVAKTGGSGSGQEGGGVWDQNRAHLRSNHSTGSRGPWGPGPPCPQDVFFFSCSFQTILRGKPIFWANIRLRVPPSLESKLRCPPPKSWIHAWLVTKTERTCGQITRSWVFSPPEFCLRRTNSKGNRRLF